MRRILSLLSSLEWLRLSVCLSPTLFLAWTFVHFGRLYKLTYFSLTCVSFQTFMHMLPKQLKEKTPNKILSHRPAYSHIIRFTCIFSSINSSSFVNWTLNFNWSSQGFKLADQFQLSGRNVINRWGVNHPRAFQASHVFMRSIEKLKTCSLFKFTES